MKQTDIVESHKDRIMEWGKDEFTVTDVANLLKISVERAQYLVKSLSDSNRLTSTIRDNKAVYKHASISLISTPFPGCHNDIPLGRYYPPQTGDMLHE